MQGRTLRSVVPSLAAVLVALGALPAIGCHKESTAPPITRSVNVTIPMNSTNAANGTTALLNGQTFTGISGSMLEQNAVPHMTPGLTGQSVTISFTAVSGANANFTLSASNVSATGTVRFASCTFTIVTTTNPAVLPVGTVITIADCSVTYTATGVPVGSLTGTNGTVKLNFNGTSSNPLDTTVQIRGDGTLLVTNGLGTVIITIVLITGSTGG